MMFQGEDFFNSTVGLQAGGAGRLPRDRHFPVYISLLKLRTVISRNTKSHCNVLMSAFFFFFLPSVRWWFWENTMLKAWA